MPGIFGDGQRGGIFGAKVDPRLLQAALEQRAEAERQRQEQARIAGAFDASQGMQQPSQALYAAKHQRAMDVLGNRPPVEPGFWSDFASLGPRAVGGAQKMWQAAPAAAGALWNDPLGSVNRAGLAGQAATDAIVRAVPQPAARFNDPRFDQVKNAFDLASVAGSGPANPLTLMARGKPVASSVVRGLEDYTSRVPTIEPALEPEPGRISNMLSSAEKKNPTHTLALTGQHVIEGAPGSKLPYTNLDLLRDYPGLAHVKDAPAEQVLSEYLKLGSDNLIDLHGRMDPAMRDEAMQWYDGAHDIAGAWSENYGIPHASVSGAIASLSPQKDWFQNASLAQRVMDISLGKADQPWSPDMTRFLLEKPLRAKGKKNIADAQNFVDRYRPMMEEIGNKRLDQLDDPTERALFIRMFDEVNHPREYRTITPRGQFSEFALNDDGTLAKVGWGSLGEIGKADAALRSGGDLRVLSPLMGGRHKVRNFFNNISVPMLRRFGDTTIDTHATAAIHYRPLAGGSTEVEHSLATGPGGGRPAVQSGATGVQGTYGFGQDATRLAADKVGLLPRQMQSITWEQVRSMFTPVRKRDKNFMAAAEDIWRRVDASKRAGRITPQQARNAIADLIEQYGGAATPSWQRRGIELHDPKRVSTY
jgi:hypothetical protein